jgi:hypothetical protein
MLISRAAEHLANRPRHSAGRKSGAAEKQKADMAVVSIDRSPLRGFGNCAAPVVFLSGYAPQPTVSNETGTICLLPSPGQERG